MAGKRGVGTEMNRQSVTSRSSFIGRDRDTQGDTCKTEAIFGVISACPQRHRGTEGGLSSCRALATLDQFMRPVRGHAVNERKSQLTLCHCQREGSAQQPSLQRDNLQDAKGEMVKIQFLKESDND